jgi:tetratricopeptide (TPR) repeat protein
VQAAGANQKALRAIKALMADPVSGLNVAKLAVSFNSPHIDDIRGDISRSTAQILSSSWQKMDKNQANALLSFTTDNLEKNLILHPLDIRNGLTLGQMYQLGAAINNNATYLLKTEKVLTDALEKSPKRQQIIYSLAGVKIQLGKNKEAISILEQALKDNPKISETYWRLAYSYQFDHQDIKAQDIIKQAVDNGINFTDQEKDMIKQFFVLTNTSTIINKTNKK